MTEEILKNLYKIEIPLPQNPLRAVNSYVIKDQEQTLIIDTGMNRKECRNAISAGLSELGIDLRKSDFFITHLHADHLGLVSSLATDGSRIYFNQPDIAIVRSATHWQENSDLAKMNGFPEDELQKAIKNHPGYRYGGGMDIEFNILRGGDTIDIGDYQFICIETPGHTKGHMCLYEPKRKLFVSGDHILSEITPNISSWSCDENPLNEYLASLDKVSKLDVERVLPGHGSIFTNCQKRIQELKDHHKERADEVLSILERGSENAYNTASQMSWDIEYKSWGQFPVQQKWFATGEAISHLNYLEKLGRIRREVKDQKTVYALI